jgi:hypothetical protein
MVWKLSLQSFSTVFDGADPVRESGDFSPCLLSIHWLRPVIAFEPSRDSVDQLGL